MLNTIQKNRNANIKAKEFMRDINFSVRNLYGLSENKEFSKEKFKEIIKISNNVLTEIKSIESEVNKITFSMSVVKTILLSTCSLAIEEAVKLIKESNTRLLVLQEADTTN